MFRSESDESDESDESEESEESEESDDLDLDFFLTIIFLTPSFCLFGKQLFLIKQ